MNVYVGDTAELYAGLRLDEQPLGADQIAQVNFTVQKPDGSQVTEMGIVLDDGQGFLRWTDTAEVGLYLVKAQFVLVSGETSSDLLQFSVEDPFGDAPTTTIVGATGQVFPTPTLITTTTDGFTPSGQLVVAGVTGIVSYTGTTGTTFTGCTGGTGTATVGGAIWQFLTPSAQELISEAVWLRLEDCFDSELGGPWLRDKTLANFDETKIQSFIPEALLDINTQMPPTNMTVAQFTNWSVEPGDNPNMPILVKATLLRTIRHLMMSYTEQPTPQGAQVVWSDRTRYQQMWKAIYDVELADYTQTVRLWKRTTLNLGHSALSIFSKSGRQWPYSNQRARGAYRGY
jgi:hypothetical protein